MGRFSTVVLSAVTLAAASCAVAVGTALPAGASQSAARAVGTAQAVPGLAALSTGKQSQINALSCGSAGNCAAGGGYTDSSGSGQGFVVDETGGSWGMAQAIPGLAALNTDGSLYVTSVSCASAGNCAAVGYYYMTATEIAPFVVDETGGSWGKAQEISGTDAIGAGPYAAAYQVTCPSAGNCVATGEAGYYLELYPGEVRQGFVAEESDGSWGKAEPAPGVTPGSTPGGSSVHLSCWSAGNCLAAVWPADSSGDLGLVVETDGSWGTGQEVPGLTALGNAVRWVSCGSAGNCAIAGAGFVAAESGGSWGTVQYVPGWTGGFTDDTSVSCGAAGTCAAVGTYIYLDPSDPAQGFGVTESGGSWRTVQEISSTAAADGTQVGPVSCPPAGDCAAGGTFTASASTQAFLVDEAGGSWTTPQEVPGLAALSASENTTSTGLSLSAARVTYGKEQAERVSVAVSAPSGGTPSGTVTVKAGTAIVCGSIRLSAGRASCTVAATKLPAGTWHLTASYSGTASLLASTSAASTLMVAKAASRVTLRLSAAKVTYGKERSERLTVKVSGQYAGTPGGKVTVKSGKTTVCTITLSADKGSCTLGARKFRAGTRTLTAVYSGSRDFTGAASARKTLKVVT